MGPIVHELNQVFEERNLFLLVTLGLVSASLRFRELAIRYGNQPADAPAARVPRRKRKAKPAQPAEEEQTGLDLLLGVASFTGRALEMLERVRDEAATAPKAKPAPVHDDGEPISLRRLLG